MLLIAGLMVANLSPAATPGVARVAGHYSDAHLAAFGRLTLPRSFLYDSSNRLVPQEHWPAELADVKRNVGDAYCCVSDEAPSAGNEPPANCVKIVYGTDVAESFTGLLDGAGTPLVLASLPAHRWLLVEYFATWCAPCIEERKALEHFFATSRNAGDYLWVSIDMSRMIDAKDAATP